MFELHGHRRERNPASRGGRTETAGLGTVSPSPWIVLVAVLVGYLGVRDESHIELQLPYLISGGLGGLVLMGLGALVLIQYQMRIQARRFAEMTDTLDEWKEQAIAELRSFLEAQHLGPFEAAEQRVAGIEHEREVSASSARLRRCSISARASGFTKIRSGSLNSVGVLDPSLPASSRAVRVSVLAVV